MNNFDLKKFLVENKLTTASKLTKENIPNSSTKGRHEKPDGTVLETVNFQDDTEQENIVFSISTVVDSNTPVVTTASHEPFERTIVSVTETGEEFDVTELGVLDWIIETGLEEGYWREGSEEDTHPFVINGDRMMPEIENWLMRDEYLLEGKINENEDLTVTEQPTQNEVSKYLKHESAQAILSELENEIALAGLDLRKEQIQKIVQEIESKISTLEEDAGMQGFVDKAAINEKRKVVKELNKAYEKVNKLSEKMHAKRKKKMK